MTETEAHIAECHRCREDFEFDEPVVVHTKNGHSGTGYYVYEEEYPEDGSVFLGTLRAWRRRDT